MSNVFDQFDAAPPGVAPQTEAAPKTGAGNIFDQFNADPVTGEVRGSAPAPTATSPTMAERIKTAAPSLYTSIYENPMLGAEQKTMPQPERYGKPLATANDMFISDSGETSFRDPSGAVIPTDRSKHAILAGPDGRLAVYQRSDATAESPVVGFSRIATMGLGSNAPTTARAVAATAPSIEATIPELRKTATAVFESPEVLSRQVAPDAVAAAFNEIRPQLVNRDPTVIKALTDELSGLGAGQITIRDLNHASERLGVLAGQTTGPLGSQTATPLAQAATVVKKQIDNVMRAAAPEYAIADQNYSAMKAAQTIVGRGDLAQVKARGGDFADKMAQQATSLLANPKYTRGFQPDEIAQLQAISEGKLKGEGLLNAASWLSGKIATVGGAAAGFVGYQHGGPMTAVGSAIGGLAIDPIVQGILTRMGNRLATNQVNALSEAIRARSPLGQQLAQNAKDWESAWKEMQSTPSSMTLTNLARSSRDLANALRSAGVEVGPAQLMRGAKPDENQQNVPRPPRQ